MLKGNGRMNMWLHTERKMIGALLCVLFLLFLLVPLTWILETGRKDSTEDEMQRRIGDMHVRHAAHLDREPGMTVEPAPDIEEIWAIEDTRAEAESSLVSEMHANGGEMGFDRESMTFYCPIGANLEQWPEVSFTVRGAEGVRAVFVDDYTYDFCMDAVREGYRYEMMAYTDTEFSYVGVVFTGLPVVTLHVEDASELSDTYIPARVSVAGGGYEAIDSAALVHLRGGGFFKGIDKPNYRVEFHRLSDKGKDKKSDVEVLGMNADSDWLLVGNAGDPSCMRNAMGFDMWDRWNEGKDVFARLESRMVEVFVQDEYMGMYQLLERIDEEKELLSMGGSLDTDVITRLIGMRFETGRPVSQIALPIGGCLELRLAPAWMKEEDAFAEFENYVLLNLSPDHEAYLDDAAFAELALRSVDVYDIMSYYLFMNVCAHPFDNVKNNVYLWARKGEDGYTYMLSPWDMDSTLRPLYTDETDSVNLWMVLPSRMLDLNVGGCREVFWQIWREKTASLLTEDAIYQWVSDTEEAINATGAYLRETERWRDGADTLDLTEISAYTTAHLATIERYMLEVWPIEDAAQQEN